MRLHELSTVFKGCGFKVFDSVLEKGGVVKALCARGCGEFSRKTTDGLTEFVKKQGAQGLVFLKVVADGCEGSAAKFFSKETTASMLQKLEAQAGDMIFMVAAERPAANLALGSLRLEIGRMKNLLSGGDFKFLWVTSFPLFEFSRTEGRYAACHHPFTAPLDEDVGLLYGPEYHLARAKAYDLVLNGNEIGGGSIRIHNAGLQSKIFELLGISEREAEKKFGFLLSAFKYGAPPHGGIAFGLDRLLMLMIGLDSIRDVIPFPKTTTGSSLMDDCPSEVGEDQLDELGIALKKQEKEGKKP
jgi:aspartyl-tRNA synthetase